MITPFKAPSSPEECDSASENINLQHQPAGTSYSKLKAREGRSVFSVCVVAFQDVQSRHNPAGHLRFPVLTLLIFRPLGLFEYTPPPAKLQWFLRKGARHQPLKTKKKIAK